MPAGEPRLVHDVRGGVVGLQRAARLVEGLAVLALVLVQVALAVDGDLAVEARNMSGLWDGLVAAC